jgi:hypothetical protein
MWTRKMTNWDAVGAIAELVGATAVLITLVYLVIQVRQHSRSISSMTTQAIFGQFNELSMQLASDPILARAFEQGMSNPESLSDEDASRFTWLARTMMNIWMNLYDQYIQGACPKYLWLRTAGELKAMYDLSPGLQRFRETDPGFESLFEYVDQMTDDDYGDLQAFHNFRKDGS